EISGVGLTEEQAKEKGEVKVGKFPMLANSRAKTNHEPDGLVKVVADAQPDRELGVWLIASVARTMIAQARHAMEFGASRQAHALRGAQASGNGRAGQADPHLAERPKPLS